MTLKTEKEIRQVVQIAVATAMYLWGFPSLAVVLVVLILPWNPVYKIAAYLGEWSWKSERKRRSSGR